MTDVLAQAAALRREADALLDDAGLLAIIGRLGPTRVVGSYALDLMTWRDIDISVCLAEEHDIGAFFDAGRDIATRFQTTRMTFSDWLVRPGELFGLGLYWGIRLFFGGENWKVDLWGFGQRVFRDKIEEFDRLDGQLRAADRLAIMTIKDEVCRRPNYRAEIISIDIYEAVCEHGVRTVPEFDDWVASRVKGRMQ